MGVFALCVCVCVCEERGEGGIGKPLIVGCMILPRSSSNMCGTKYFRPRQAYLPYFNRWTIQPADEGIFAGLGSGELQAPHMDTPWVYRESSGGAGEGMTVWWWCVWGALRE